MTSSCGTLVATNGAAPALATVAVGAVMRAAVVAVIVVGPAGSVAIGAAERVRTSLVRRPGEGSGEAATGSSAGCGEEHHRVRRI